MDAISMAMHNANPRPLPPEKINPSLAVSPARFARIPVFGSATVFAPVPEKKRNLLRRNGMPRPAFAPTSFYQGADTKEKAVSDTALENSTVGDESKSTEGSQRSSTRNSQTSKSDSQDSSRHSQNSTRHSKQSSGSSTNNRALITTTGKPAEVSVGSKPKVEHRSSPLQQAIARIASFGSSPDKIGSKSKSPKKVDVVPSPVKQRRKISVPLGGAMKNVFKAAKRKMSDPFARKAEKEAAKERAAREQAIKDQAAKDEARRLLIEKGKAIAAQMDAEVAEWYRLNDYDHRILTDTESEVSGDSASEILGSDEGEIPTPLEEETYVNGVLHDIKNGEPVITPPPRVFTPGELDFLVFYVKPDSATQTEALPAPAVDNNNTMVKNGSTNVPSEKNAKDEASSIQSSGETAGEEDGYDSGSSDKTIRERSSTQGSAGKTVSELFRASELIREPIPRRGTGVSSNGRTSESSVIGMKTTSMGTTPAHQTVGSCGYNGSAGPPPNMPLPPLPPHVIRARQDRANGNYQWARRIKEAESTGVQGYSYDSSPAQPMTNISGYTDASGPPTIADVTKVEGNFQWWKDEEVFQMLKIVADEDAYTKQELIQESKNGKRKAKKPFVDDTDYDELVLQNLRAARMRLAHQKQQNVSTMA